MRRFTSLTSLVTCLSLLAGCSDRQTTPNAISGSTSTSPTNQLAGSDWSLKDYVDPLTDKRIVTASLSVIPTDSATPPELTARCIDHHLELFVAFDVFLNHSGSIPIRYRFDHGPLIQQEWDTSAKGTAAFASSTVSISIMRQLAKSESLIFEANDFSGSPHRATFNVMHSEDTIASVMKACNLTVAGLAALVPGLRTNIAAEIEVFGPKQIATYKEILISLGRYTGPVNVSLDPEFATAVQRLLDDYVKSCADKRQTQLFPTQYCSLNLSEEYISVHRIFAEASPKSLYKQASVLRQGD